MGVRKYSWLVIQLSLFSYILCIGLYFIFRNTYPTSRGSSSLVNPIMQYTPTSRNQPDSYTIHPNSLPDFKETVQLPPPTNASPRQAAAFIVLVKNSELLGMLQSISDVEQRFNKKFNYPWVFLNDKPFTREFINATSHAVSGKTHYGLVDQRMWGYPDWVDQKYAAQQREEMKNTPYGLSQSYRHMCRFQSGFFFRHPLIQSLNLEYYWRVEPSVRYFCDLDYDPFLYLKQNNKKYGFNISFKEHQGTIPTLWKTVKEFARNATDEGTIHFPNKYKDSLLKFLSHDEGESYNGCHFWTNMEIARLDIWHTPEYKQFFKALDKTGKFFYERWGDAPVHSIFVSLFLKQEEVHFFNDIGYKHSIYQHCPAEESLVKRCTCEPGHSIDFTDRMSCLTEYMQARFHDYGSDERTVNDVLIRNM